MITAKQQEADIIRGFDLGADDYITKPFRLRELLVRMRAVLRRAAPKEEQRAELDHWGYDPGPRQARGAQGQASWSS